MEKEPARLAEVGHIPRQGTEDRGKPLPRSLVCGEVMLTFSQYGLTPNEALRCWKRFGLDGGEDPGEPVSAVQQRAVHRL